MTLRLDEETSLALDALAKATDRSKSYLALRAIDEFIRLNAWQVDAIREGIADADAGELLEHDELKRRWSLRLENPLD
jgi:predicted transcriptional regulator